MSRPYFTIDNIGAQEGSPSYDTFLTPDILKDISRRLYNIEEYDVEWRNQGNKGRSITCECDGKIAFINLSQYGNVNGRNSYFQSVSTAIGQYMEYREKNLTNKNVSFYFYFLPHTGNNETSYHRFQYRIMKTAGITFLNEDAGLEKCINPFTDVTDIINERNKLKERNHNKNSTYITDEGDYYHIYGKTFGANVKETVLLCLAISKIADKPIKLFQIEDNKTKYLNKNDIETINKFSSINESEPIEILDESYSFDDINDNLRTPKFFYNMLEKYGPKKCALCGCNIDSVIEGAHIYPIASIRRSNLPDEEKHRLASEADNGIWLCQNHHRLFDKGLIWFDQEGNYHIVRKVSKDSVEYIKKITTKDKIEPSYMNDEMRSNLQRRSEVKQYSNIQ